MKVQETMTREIKGIRGDATLKQAAEQMRTLDVGSLPVVSQEDQRVVGIITDRDVVVRAVARGNDPSRQHVRDVMSKPLVCCREHEDVADASKAMSPRRSGASSFSMTTASPLECSHSATSPRAISRRRS